MSIVADKARIETAKTNLNTYLTNKGVNVPPGELLDGMVLLLDSVPTGGGSDDDFIGVIERTAVNPVLPEGLTKIGAYSFYYSDVINPILPNSVTSICDAAFCSCYHLALTELPNGLTSIGDNSFKDCSYLELTEFPSTLTSIGKYAFNNCSRLTEISFNGTLTSIASNAFLGCTSLLTIRVPWAEDAVANAPWGATNATIIYDYTGG